MPSFFNVCLLVGSSTTMLACKGGQYGNESDSPKNSVMKPIVTASGPLLANEVLKGMPLATAFGINGTPIGCRAFNAYVGDPDAKRFLRISVDMGRLGLKAGRHHLDLTKAKSAVAIDVVVYDAPNRELPDCSDAAGAQPKIVERWAAVDGGISLDVSADPVEGKNFKVSITLNTIQLKSPTGQLRVIDAQFKDVEVGWLPG
jgi:hypothetical protein